MILHRCQYHVKGRQAQECVCTPRINKEIMKEREIEQWGGRDFLIEVNQQLQAVVAVASAKPLNAHQYTICV